MVKEIGAKFEKLKINECTHLVTTEPTVEDRGPKVREAMESRSCEIVSIDWLLNSIEKKKIIDVESHRLWDTKKKGKGPQSGGRTSSESLTKRKRHTADLEDGAGPAHQLRKTDSCFSSSLSDLVDEAYRGERGLVAVYKDTKDVVWDATLLKHYHEQKTQGVLTWRIQLLHNSKSGKFIVWSHEELKRGQKGKSVCAEWVSLRLALSRFTSLFEEASGLQWVNRHHLPIADKFLFIACPDMAPQVHPLKMGVGDHFPLAEGICNALNVLIKPESTALIASTLEALSANHPRTGVESKQILRLALGLLVTMSEKLDTKMSDGVQHHLVRLTECFCGVFTFPRKPDAALSFTKDPTYQWVANELDHLNFTKTLTAMRELSRPSTTTSKQEFAQQVYRILGLESVHLGIFDSTSPARERKYS
ncbi:Peptidase S10 serine carboxypeptidase [Penicillium capsulatum]|uniref:Peptidase S10 serine carboxypeptidase n=1 Tax=Penicillium capsulatum TaxID=69766 RepID=A0A9W9LYV5_9EURO|nr:Peptidase S10 serine carboxypeptidase [Penicillium capsulatum]KAJ6130625.1 Peptidase S10 serine carboxypeptidase [Penicillium capsulatum]